MTKYQLNDLNKHCFDLAYFFFHLNQNKISIFGDQHYFYWLHLAASIKDIELDLGHIGFGPKGVIDLSQPLFQNAAEKNADIVRSLVIFSLIWYTFEKMHTDYFFTPETKIAASIDAHLASDYQPYKNVIHYNSIVQELKQRIHQSEILNARSILHHVTQEDHSVVGIKLVEKIRDAFAHCAYQFPLGSDPTGPLAIDPLIIDLSSRIVLLTMQMIMIPYFEEHKQIVIKCWWLAEEPKRKMPVHAFLRTLHIHYT
jgi:hypothetical protein